jgi:hypothetical protein
LRRLAGFLFCRQRSWGSTLRSFAPAGQFTGVFPPGRPTCRLPVASTSMVLVEASAARTCEKTDCGRSECVRFDFWALTRPASRPLPVVGQGAHAALGFASFGLTDTCWCSLTGSSPSSLIGRRPFRFRRLSALGLQRRSPALPEPHWFPDQNRSRRLRFSDSSGQCLVLPASAQPAAG